MINLLKKDINLTFQVKSVFLLLLFYIPFIIFVGIFEPEDTHSIYLLAVLTFTYLSVSTPFQYELKNKTNLFIQSLPIKRSDIVISRYIYALLSFIFASLFSYIYLKVLMYLDLSGDIVLTFSLYKQVLATSLSIISVLLPINYMFDPKISNFLSTLLYIFIFIFFPELLKKYILIGNNILLFIVLLFLLSLVLSIYINNRRNFT